MHAPITLPFATVVIGFLLLVLSILTGIEGFDTDQLFILAFVIIPALVPALLGYYLGTYRVTTWCIWGLIIAANLYGLFTIYEAATCTGKLCGLVILLGLYASIASFIGYLCYVHHFTHYPLQKTGVLLGQIILGGGLIFGFYYFATLLLDTLL